MTEFADLAANALAALALSGPLAGAEGHRNEHRGGALVATDAGSPRQ